MANTSASVTVLAGELGGKGTADGKASDARFTAPWRLAADPRGGAYAFESTGVLRKVSETGEVTTVASGLPTECESLAVDAAGNVYLSANRWKILRVDGTTGAVTAVRDGLWPGRIGVGQGAVYGIRGGEVFRVDLATGADTIVAGTRTSPGYTDGKGAAARFARMAAGAAFDGTRFFYVVEYQSGYVLRRVDVTTGDVTTIALKDAAGNKAELTSPGDMAISLAGDRLLFASIGRIEEVAIATGVTTSTATPGVLNAQIVTETKAGRVLALRYQDTVVRALDRATGKLDAFAGKARDESYLPSISDKRLMAVSGLVSDGAGGLVIGEVGAYTAAGGISRALGLRRLDLTSRDLVGFGAKTGIGGLAPMSPSSFLTLSAGWVASGAGSVGEVRLDSVDFATAAVTRISKPLFWHQARFDGLAADAAGNVYFTMGGGVARMDAAGNVADVAGAALGMGNADGNGVNAKFANPKGLAFVPPSTLYVADTDNHAIRAVDLTTGDVTTLATSPLVSPTGLAYDAKSKSLYIADTADHVIRRMDVGTHAVMTVAGVPGKGGILAGPAGARLNAPRHLAMLVDGSLAVSSENEDVIVRVVPASP